MDGTGLIQKLRALRPEQRSSAMHDLLQEVSKAAGQHADLNALLELDESWVRRQGTDQLARTAKSEDLALLGLPFVVKDNIETRHYATTAGTPALAENYPNKDAPVVQKLLDAGAVLIAKSNLHELAYGITSNNAFLGAVHNPHNPDLIAGGSSGGTAAAVAAGIVPVGLGTDTGGSARIPAALCGVVGFRPSSGRYSSQGLIRISSTRDTPGTMARSVRDIALLDGVIADTEHLLPELELKGLRIGLVESPFMTNLEPAIAERLVEVLNLLDRRGVDLIRVTAPELSELNDKVGFPVVLYETVIELSDYLEQFNDRRTPGSAALTLVELVSRIASPDVRAIVQPLLGEGAIPEGVYREARDHWRPRLQQRYAELFATHSLDCLLYPTTPLTARPIGQDQEVELNGEWVPTFATYIRNCDPGANAGIPSISIPSVMLSTELPIGLSLDGAEGSDRRLLAIAGAVENALEAQHREGLRDA